MSGWTDAPHLDVADRATWRAWLEANHASATGVWLVMNRRDARTTLYEMAVEEALCFGWIDSTAGRVDDERGKLYFAPRKPRSGWAATNKARLEKLMAEGRMAPAGLAAVERAKANGSWELLDSVERMEAPADLTAALAHAGSVATANFEAWPPSIREQAFAAIAQAKRPQTRAQRIARIVDHAVRNVRPF
jgi:uncharacterized protein YdeI (YjbR/CyaY-like superfamily)